MKPLPRLILVAVERNGVLKLLRATYISQKKLYDRLMLKKISRKIIFKVVTAISCPLKALDRLT